MPFDEHPYDTADTERALEQSAVGGGTTYSPRWTREDADVIVSEASEWSRADRHDIVYVADGEVIDVSGRDYFDLSNTAVVGGRHKPDVEAGMIVANDSGPGSAAYQGLLRAHDGPGHVEGIQLRGPSWYPDRAETYQETRPTDVRCWPGYEHIANTGTLRERSKQRDDNLSRGISMYQSDSTVRNCDVHGFTHFGVSVGARTRNPSNVTIAYSKLHNCCMPGLGYPVNIYRGSVVSEYNFYNAYRHSITGFGTSDMGYVSRKDVHGPDAMLAPVDMHCLAENGGSSGDYTAGKFLHCDQSTFLAAKRFETPGWYSSRNNPAISIRGRPSSGGGYTTTNCQFIHASEDRAMDQRNVSFPTSWTRQGNEYSGPTGWSASDERGAPVDWESGGTIEEPRGQRSFVAQRRARGKAVSERLEQQTAGD